MGVEHYLVASTLIGVLAQRLVRKLCNACKTPSKPDNSILKEYDMRTEKIFAAASCDNCRKTGYSGRLGIFELMPVSPVIQEAISSGASTREIKELSIKEGMITLRQDALGKVAAGITSIAEVNRVTGS
jgi:type II secretory ATPase GspE/PulE/Tfp pilus assembly ATPase PilB-like protein